MSPAQPAFRRSRLRWYLGLVGLLGGPAALMMATEPAFGWPWRVLGVAGLPLCAAYLGLAVTLPRWVGRARIVLGVLAAALVWIVALGLLTAMGEDPGLVVPIVFFLAVPCANAAMRAEESLRVGD